MTALPAAVHPLQVRRRPAAQVRPTGAITIRPGCASDIDAIHALISRYREAGQLLPRTREDIAAHIGRFVIAGDGRQVLGCADLVPLSAAVGEVRSLVVVDSARASGIGRRLLAALRSRAAASGFTTLAALTHSPAFFIKRGFSIVPHQWLPEKVARDCQACAQFRTCGQYALLLPLIHG